MRHRPIILVGMSFVAVVLADRSWQWYEHLVRAAAERSKLVASFEASTRQSDDRSGLVHVAVYDAAAGDPDTTQSLVGVLDSTANIQWEFVTSEGVRDGFLNRFDVVIFPGGNAKQQSISLGDAGKEAVRAYVKRGGGYVGICAGAFLATTNYDSGIAIVNVQPLTGNMHVPEVGPVSITARSAGVVKLGFTEIGARLLSNGDKIGPVSVCYAGGPILSPAGQAGLPEYISLAEFRTEVWDHEPQRGTMIGTSAIVAARFGKGKVILFSPHPEMSAGLESLVTRSIMLTARLSAQ